MFDMICRIFIMKCVFILEKWGWDLMNWLVFLFDIWMILIFVFIKCNCKVISLVSFYYYIRLGVGMFLSCIFVFKFVLFYKMLIF